MAQTTIAAGVTNGTSRIVDLGSPRAVKRWSGFLANDVGRRSYFTSRYMGKGEDTTMPIMQMTELESDAGEEIGFDLNVQLRMQPVEGDEVLENKEEDLTFYTDSVSINQMRGGVNTGGRMTRKRTLHDLRKLARKRQGEWWARVFDELFFIYLAGKSEATTTNMNKFSNTEYIFPVGYAGFASNPVTAPDTNHVIWGGAATTEATLTASHDMNLDILDKAVAKVSTIGGDGSTAGLVEMNPVMVDGGEYFVAVIHPWQVYDMRKDINTGEWLDIQKSLLSGGAKDSNIGKGALGMHNGVVMQEHKAIPKATTTGAVTAASGLFLGAQAGCLAFGTSGTGLRFGWHEETRDNGNQVVISTHSIFGLKKTTFNSRDFGSMVLNTAVSDPNA